MAVALPDVQSVLLERGAELAALEGALAAGGRLVLVAGEAGVGKTALVRRFCARHGAILSKLDVRTRGEAAAQALRLGLIDGDSAR